MPANTRLRLSNYVSIRIQVSRSSISREMFRMGRLLAEGAEDRPDVMMLPFVIYRELVVR